jgi:hypothetical protein
MKQSDINKNAKLFANSLMALTAEMQKAFSQLSPEEFKSANVDMNEINKEAKAKVDELHLTMKKFENKVKNL